jgi:hypothetical protein
VHEWTTSDVTSGEFTTFSFGAGTTILRHFNMNNNINTSFYIAITKPSIALRSLFNSNGKYTRSLIILGNKMLYY